MKTICCAQKRGPDPYIRHAGGDGYGWIGDVDALIEASRTNSSGSNGAYGNEDD